MLAVSFVSVTNSEINFSGKIVKCLLINASILTFKILFLVGSDH